jgi:hypothetical protein
MHNITLLTPELANHWLYENGKRYFLVEESKVQRFAERMASGQWTDTSEISFGFDDDPPGRTEVMLDGAHRCHAVIRSAVGVPIQVTVVT